MLLGVLRRPAWQASAAGLVVAFLLATLVWQLPAGLALSTPRSNGIVFAVWPVMWIVVNALLLYNVAVASGRFDAFRDWVIEHLPNDRRVVLVVIGFCFGALLEGISGFGTPIAITSALLILVGFEPIEALTFTLIFNTAPVAFGALGAPVTVLGQVTGLSDVTLGAMIGRQLPFFGLLLPFYVMFVYSGRRSVAALWPVLLVAGLSFALSQFVASNLIDYRLTDVLASLGSLIVTIGFLQVWKPGSRPGLRHGAARPPWAPSARAARAVLAGLAALDHRRRDRDRVDLAEDPRHRRAEVRLAGAAQRRLHHALRQALRAPSTTFQPLAGGTAILVATIITALVVRLPTRRLLRLHRPDLAADAHRHPDGRADRRPRLSHELFGHDLYARQGGGLGRRRLPAGLGLPGLGRGVPVGSATRRATPCSATSRPWPPTSSA